MAPRKSPARTKLLDAALTVIRQRGFAATSVDDLCKAAGVTKGAFFHHFDSKEALGAAAADHWSTVTGEMFAAAPFHQQADPLARILGYLELRRALIEGTPSEFSCVAGTMVQETFGASETIREACKASIFGHARTLERDIEAAMEAYGLTPDWSARSLALHTQAVLQGAFILAKASDDPEDARAMVDHLIRYVRSLFSTAPAQEA